MSRRKTAILLSRSLQNSRIAQVAVIVAMWLAGEAISRLSGLPVPGAVIGMFALLALLATGVIRLSSMRRGAYWLLADMLLFFIPAVLAVLDHGEFIGLIGLKIIAVILAGTLAVMCMTALAVDLGYRLMVALENRRVHA
ncbi:holin-like protein [Neorhizobium alkalisoli]|uniref:Holin-like protein n=2 Tax=Neorhizobium alkalisoli TaxID=528178 RepID=A0A561R230_9HYPH|nr:CidA/LrgA family protein [Neorhizobium alkalisoli]TWF56671.1 holin-like protein [Neorhizobium alkalisoli]